MTLTGTIDGHVVIMDLLLARRSWELAGLRLLGGVAQARRTGRTRGPA
ncbi:hypothetical protein ACWGCW_01765 [Streptomyces sp. NPDC054933]